MPTSKPIPFRDMRPALKTAQMETQMLLGLPNVEWPNSDYAVFMALAQISERITNPSRKQMVAHLGAWLRFYKRLLQSLPEDHAVRVKVQPEFDKLAEPYKTFLETESS